MFVRYVSEMLSGYIVSTTVMALPCAGYSPAGTASQLLLPIYIDRSKNGEKNNRPIEIIFVQ